MSRQLQDMTTEKKRKIAKVLSLIVVIAGVSVMIGWIFDIGILKSISPAWISMKFDTAIAFFLSGIILYFIVRSLEGEFDKAQIALSISSLIIMLLMGILFFSTLLRVPTGAEELFVKDTSAHPKSISPGMPSIPTMLNFFMIASAGIYTMFNPQTLRTRLRIIGLVVGVIGLLAIAGYILNSPALYYYVKDINPAMACHTAILFVVLSAGLLCL